MQMYLDPKETTLIDYSLLSNPIVQDSEIVIELKGWNQFFLKYVFYEILLFFRGYSMDWSF